MGSEWTDESVIRRDLSLAQGQWVPCGIEAVVAGEKPPAHVIAEETEEEYYKHWTADGDFSTGPNLSLIKEMLDMVHEDGPEDEDSCPAPLPEIVIRKVNPLPLPLPFAVTKKTAKPKNAKEKPIKPRRARNAAIASLLAIEQLAPEAPIKLSKPEDFIIKEKPALIKDEIDALKRKNESVKKVNSWLHSQNLSCMFKKKSSMNSINKENEEQTCVKAVESRENCDKSYKKCVTRGGAYTPSSFAQEYYQSCIKRSQMQEIVKDTIWAQAEKAMKEIDERKEQEIRKRQEVEAALNIILEAAEEEICNKSEANHDSENTEQDEPTKALTVFEKIELPQHRHQLTGECIVCKILVKKNADQTNQRASLNIAHTAESSEGSDKSNVTFTIQNESELEKSDESNEEIFNLFRYDCVENLENLNETDFKENGSIEELDIFA